MAGIKDIVRKHQELVVDLYIFCFVSELRNQNERFSGISSNLNYVEIMFFVGSNFLCVSLYFYVCVGMCTHAQIQVLWVIFA